MAELSVTPPLLFGSLAASYKPSSRKPLGFAPPPHDEFAFLASAPEMRVQAHIFTDGQ
jgi:hypothetical protein